tara:strand:- start:170 stop:355 length:186 start_codon:yes stop_codon:yes gene_type:complete
MCGACEAIAPDVFEVPEKMIVVKGADLSLNEEIVRNKIINAIENIFESDYYKDNPDVVSNH